MRYGFVYEGTFRQHIISKGRNRDDAGPNNHWMDPAEANAAIASIAAGETPQAIQERGLPRLGPFAKAYSGLTDAEIRRVDGVIRRTTREKFGPVRSVVPSLVFQIGFEGIQPSSRHQSGIAVRFPRILRWRDDKSPADADTLDALQALLAA